MKKIIKLFLLALISLQGFSSNVIENNYSNNRNIYSNLLIDNPSITINESLQVFTACIGSPSQTQTFSVSGTDLTANINIQAPIGYEISNDNGLNWSSLITLNQNSGTVASTNILIRIASSTTTITNSSIIQINSGSINETISIDGYVINSASMDPGSISGDQIICSPGNPTNIISTNDGNSGLPNLPNTTISYQWQISTDNINWTTVSGVNTSSYNPPSGVNVTTYYRRILIVKVGNNFSCSSLPSNLVNATFINGFTVNAGQDIIVCKGQTINLNAVSSGTTENVTYTWSGPSFTNSSQNASISNAVSLMSGNYTVTASISSGCNVTDIVNVLVIDEPSISTTMPTDQEVLVRCVTSPSATSGPVGFTLNIPSYSNNILNYTINWGSGSPLTQTFDSSNWSNQITHVYGLGLSPFTITINTVNGCSTSKVYNAFVGSSPAAATLVLNQNEANGCAPLTTTWTLTIPNNIIGTNYTCDWGEISNQDDFILNHGGTIPSNTSTMIWSGPTINPSTQVTTYIITKIFSNSSCGNNVILGSQTYYNAFQPVIITRNPCTVTPQPSGSGLVTIGRKPQANFTPSPFPTKICTGVPLQVLNTSLFGQTIPSNNGATCTNTAQFYWTITRLTAPFTGGATVSGNLGSNNGQPAEFFDMWTSGSMSPTITFNQTGTYRITLTIANSCGQDSIYKDICVQSRVTPAFLLDINQGCKPLIVSATNNSDTSVSCSNTTYLWNVTYSSNYCGTSSSFTFLNGTNNTSVNPVFQFNNAGTYNITLVTTNDCGSITSAMQTVIVKQPPTVSINTIPNYCGTATINPTASVNICSPTGSPTTYLWTFTGATTIPAGADTAINPSGIVYSTPGTYTVSLVVTNECGSTSDTKTFTVNAIPTITGNLVICAQGTTQLTGSATAATTTPWTSSNASVATVSSTGLVTGVSAGTTTITYTNSNGCQTTATITVNALPTITGTLNVCIGSTRQLTGSATAATTSPWTSSNTSVATVDDTGLVTGVSAGTTTITYTNSNGCQRTVTFTVNALPTITGTLNVCIGSTRQLTGSATAATTSPWTSSVPGVATVSSTGLVTGVSEGTTTITYTNSNGCQTTATITVNALPTITGNLVICAQSTTQLTGSVTAATTTPWASSNTSVATVSSTGLVTGVSAGTTTITYTNSNGCQTTATITVNALPTITGTLNTCIGSTRQLTGSATAATASPWTSSNTSVATVDDTGLVTGLIAGTTTITYTNSNGCQRTITFTVNALPTITGNLVICAQGTTQLTGSATAATTTPWTSSNTSVATVSSTGLVTGVSAGTTTITYTNSNGCQTTATITVNALPTITGNLIICAQSTTQLTGSATAATTSPWTSSNTSVATVDDTGLVTGVSAGTTTITYTNSNGCQRTVTFTVNALPTITGTLNVCIGSTRQLTGSATAATTSPWTSSVPGVATVSSTGLVTGVSEGTTTITYTNSNGCQTTATITVNALPTITGNLVICAQSTTQLTGSVTAATTTPWASSNTSVATVSSTGLVTGVSAGTTTITYTNSNGCQTTATITVNALPTITGTLNTCIGSTRQLTGSATAATASPWTSSNTSVATVDDTGLVTGLIAGTTTITYTNSNGCQRTITFTVNAIPTITGNLVICAQGTTQLTGSATAATTTPWTSSNASVATVSSTGLVTGVSAGTTTITYTNSNGCQTTATITVNALPTITGNLIICAQSTTQLTGSATAATTSPWTSSNTSVATVDDTGLVTGVSAGTTTITYTNSNGCQRTVTFTVNALPTITGTLNVCIGSTRQLTGSATAATTSPWTSSVPGVATVSSTGLVTGVSEGTTTITYTNSNGCQTTATITVNALPTITGNLVICAQSTTQLTGSVTAATTTPWASSNTSVATVSSTGLVTGVSAGTTTITYTNSNGCQTTATITVNALPTITGTLNTCIGSTRQLTGSATAATASPWTSSNTSVATVDDTGLVTGLIAGTTTITYTNSNGCQRTITFTVNALPTITGNLVICAQGTTQLTGSATAATTTPWTSSNTSVATVSSTGLVTGVSAGTTTITYTNSNGCQTTATITVNALPTITGTLNVCIGSTRQLTGSATAATTSPWTSSNTSVATVDDTGLVTGVSAGTTTITYTNSNGCQRTVTFTVNALPTITGTLNVCIGSTRQLTGSATAATTSPWTSSVPGVATVSSTGLVTGVSEGTTTITYTNSNGCQTTATITVNALPTITGNLVICAQSTTQLTGSVTAATTTPWASSNTSVATVSSTGLVTGVSAGTTTITYTNSNGCQTTATITVNALPTITGTLNTCIGSTRQLTGSATAATASPWTSSNTSVATVDDTGLVTGLIAGTTTITYTNSNGCQRTITFTVNALPTITGNLVICAQGTTQLTGSATAATTTPWTSSNTSVATVSSTGLVTGVSAGTTTITYTNSNGCQTTATITVNALPTITGNLIICAQSTTQLTGSATAATTSPWTSSNTSVATVDDTGLVTGVSAGTTTITYTNSNGCQTTKTVTVNPKPVISNKTTTICSGEAFTVTPLNNAPTEIVPNNILYTWTVLDNPDVTGETNGGPQASISQVLTNITNTNQFVVYTVTPVSGTCIGNTFTVTVTVNPKPIILNKTTTICSGETFTVIPLNNAPTEIVPNNILYSWTVANSPNVIGESNGGPQPSISQTLTNSTNLVQTIVYTVTPVSGICIGNTFTVTVTVNPKPVISNKVAAICSGETFTVSPINIVGSDIVPVNTTYTWTVLDNPDVTGETNGGPQLSISQTLSNETSLVQTVIYSVIPTSGASGNCTGASFTVTVTVNPKPIISNKTITICSGAVFTVTPSNGLSSDIVPTNTIYTWTVVDNPDVTGDTSGGPQSSVSQLLINNTNIVQVVVYTVTPMTGSNCVGTTFTVTVTVNPKPVISNKVAAICSGETFTVTPINIVGSDIVPANTTYTWTVANSPNIIGESNGGPQSSISQELINTTNTVQTVIYTITPTSGVFGNCVGSSFTITVTVNPKPVISNKTTTICSGEAFTVTPLNNAPTEIVPNNILYTWTVLDNPDVTGETNGGPQASISQVLTNITNTNQFVVYTVTPVSGTCIGNTFTVTVTVNPKPIILNKTTTICSGETFTVIPLNNAPTEIVPNNILYSWTVANSPNVIGESNGGPQPSISQTLTNSTNLVQTIVYTVTPVSGICIGNTFTVTVTVNPKPVISNKVAAICSGETFTVSPINIVGSDIVPVNTTYTWTVLDNPDVTGETNGGPQLSISQTLSNETSLVQTVIYSVIPTSGASGNCTGASFTVTVTVNPKPIISNKTITICSGAVFTVTPSNGLSSDIVPTNTIYTWTVVDNPDVTGDTSGGPQSSVSQLLINNTNIVQVVVYTVTPMTGSNCVGTTFTVTVTVNPKPVISNKVAAICSGETFTVTPINIVGSDIVPANTTYTWTVANSPNIIGESNGGPQSSISQELINTTNTVQTVIYTITPTSGVFGNCVGSSFTITVTVNPKPVISNKTTTICSGEAFTVTPLNNAPTEIVPNNILYTWTVLDNPDVTGETNGGPQASISQVLTNITNTNQFVVYTVTPVSGTCIGNTFTVTVTVNPKPIILNKTTTICSGETFTVIPLNNAPTEIVPNNILYSWTVANSPNVIGESNGGPQPSISQTLTNSTNLVQTIVYTVTPVSGICIGNTFTVTVTVNPKPVISNKVAAICSGETFTVSPINIVGSDIVPVNTTYTWTVLDNPDVTGETNGGPQLSISQTLSNETSLVQTVIYSVIPTSGASGNCTGASFTVTVTVNPKPIISNKTITICSGAVFTVTPSNGLSSDIVPTNTIYTWTVVDNPDVTGDTSGGPQSSVSQLLINNTNIVQVVVYTVTPMTGSNCVGTTFTVTVTVNPKPVISNKVAAICSGETFTVTPINIVGSDIVPANTTYTWTVANSPNIIGESNGGPQSSISQELINTTNTVQTVIYTITPTSGVFGNCVGSSFTITVTVNPKPVISNKTTTICSGEAFTVTPLNNAPTEIVPNNILYTWTVLDNPDVTGETNGGPQASISQVLTNITNTNQFVVYTVTPVSGTCIGNTFTVTVTVNPTPKVNNKQFETCSGESFSYLPINNAPTEIVPVGTTYSWSFVDNLSITGETNGTNQLQFAQLNLTNNTNINQIVVFTVTATSGSCSSTFEIQLTVKPKPFVPNPSGLTDTRCSGDTFVIVPQNGIPTSATIVPAGTTYSWTFIDNPNVTGETIGIGQPTITQVLTNLTNVNQSVQYTVTPLSGTCQGLPFTVVFWVEPKPFIPNVIETVCDGGSFILTPVNGLVPTTNTIVPNITLYSWTASASVNVTGFTTGTNQPFFNSGILVNGGPTVQTVTYIVTPTYYVSSNPGIPRCIGDSFTITVSVNPGVEDNEVITNIACSYSPLCGGSIVLNPVGVGPFTYVWTYTGTGINAITNPTLQNQLNLCPGNYQVEITDSLNCTYTFNYVIQPPTPIVSSLVTLQNISCNNVNVPPCDGYIELAVSGGTPFATPNASGQVYTFEWYKETPLGSGNFTLITSGSPILMNACVGNYKLKVVDANGCIHWSVPYLIENQFTLINIVETISNYNGFEIACNGGNSGYVHNVISGGSGTYNYVFLNQTTGSIISQGVVNASIPTPPGSINLNFDNLVSGTYQLTITDPFCPNNIVRTYVLDAPTQLQSSFTLVSLPVQCYNGTATYNVTATGGVGPYSGTGNYTLAAGVHPIVVTNSNGCTSTQVITVTQPTELVPQVVLTSPILCFGGTAQVTVTATGGTGAYIGTGTFTVTAGGPYNYTVTDANGCTKQVSITVTQPSQLSFVIDSTQNPTCSPDRSYSNGSICITISGGTNPTPVGAGWVNIGGNKWCLNNLSAGNYTINVTDLNSCASTGVQNVTLTRPTPLQAFINNNIQVNCATSTVTQNNYVFANGGTPPYTFTWSGGVACNPANPQCMTTTINGNYIAYVNDAEGIANGCPPIEVPFVVNLIEIGTPSFTFSSYASINCGSLAIKDPILFTNTSTGDYASLSWFVNGVLVSNQETFTHEFDEVGDYTVTLTVNYTIAGITCTYSETEVLSITNGYDIVIPNAFTPNGDGINDTIRPVYKCMDKMEMSVYDTWGSLLYFEEDTDLKGWDGTINGKEAENGNYIIVVRATTFAGKDLFINGPVTLIK